MAAATVMMRPSTTHAFNTLIRSARLLPSSVSFSSGLRRRFLSTGKSRSPGTPFFLLRGTGGGSGAARIGEATLAVRRRLGGVRAAQVNEPGSIDSPMMQSMESKIKEELKADVVTVKDAYGDGRHVSIYVVSSAFEGQSSVNRQRLVYKAIWEELQSTVHAVDQMVTLTPVEAEK